MKGLDGIAKQVLDALMQDPRADAATLGTRLNLAPDVVQARIDRMQENGYLRGFAVRLDSDRLGVPHEVMVTATPTDKTTRERLTSLCGTPGVTRVWTLASRSSVAFTLRGADAEAIQRRAAELATEAGLTEPTITLIVDTLFDESGTGVHGAWRTAQ